MTTYIVSKGDTLSKIAGRFGVSVTAIATANGIANINLIRVGQSLNIPTKTESARGVYIPMADRAQPGQATLPGSATASDDLSEVNVTAQRAAPYVSTSSNPARQVPTGPSELLGVDLSQWLKPPKLFYLLASLAAGAFLLTTTKRRR